MGIERLMGNNGTQEKEPIVLFSDRIVLDLMQKGQWEELSKKHFGDSGQDFRARSESSIENFLSEYLGKKVELLSTEQDKNVYSGFPVWNFRVKLK